MNAFKQFCLRLKEGVKLDELMAAANNYAADIKRRSTPEDKILHAKTFLGQARRYEEYVKGVDMFEQSTGRNREDQTKIVQQ